MLSATQEVDKLFSDWRDQPGAVIAILERNEVVFRRAYGLSDLAGNQPLNENSVFHICSLSKMFTAAATLSLVPSIETPVRKILPDLKINSSVTVADLLGMVSGVRNVELLTLLAGQAPRYAGAREDWMRLLTQSSSSLYAPKLKSSYVNTNFIILSTLLERIHNRSFGDCVSETVLEPLGMYATHLRETVELNLPALARGHALQASGRFLPIDHSFGLAGSGGFVSTIDDMIAWARTLLQPSHSLKPIITRMCEPTVLSSGQATSYGLGLFVGRLLGRRAIGHNGRLPGHGAQVLAFPDDEVAIIYLSNRGDGLAFHHALRLAALVFGEELPAVPDRTRPAVEYWAAANGCALALCNERAGRVHVNNYGQVSMSAPARSSKLKDVGATSLIEYEFRPSGTLIETISAASTTYRKSSVAPSYFDASIRGRYRSKRIGPLILEHEIRDAGNGPNVLLQAKAGTMRQLRAIDVDRYAVMAAGGLETIEFTMTVKRSELGIVSAIEYNSPRLGAIELQRIGD